MTYRELSGSIRRALLGGVVVVVTGVVVGACGRVTPTSAPAPSTPTRPPSVITPAPKPITSVPAVAHGGPWSFSYTPGTYSYTIATEGVIAPLSDTTQKRSAQSAPERATITVSPTGTVQVVAPVSQGEGACDAAAATVTRAQELIPVLPANMTAGESWTDSTTTDGCRGSVPATAHVAHTYTALSDTTFAGVTALHVHRDDIISATGEGAEGQHRVLISAMGSGSAELFFDVSTGRFLGSDGVQNSTVDINTSGRVSRFLQHVTQRVSIVTP